MDEVVYEATEDNAPVAEADVIEAAAEVTEAEVEVATEE